MVKYKINFMNICLIKFRKSIKITFIGTTMGICSMFLIACNSNNVTVAPSKSQDKTVTSTAETSNNSSENNTSANKNNTQATLQAATPSESVDTSQSGSKVKLGATSDNVNTTNVVAPSDGNNSGGGTTAPKTPTQTTTPPSTPTTPTAPSTAIKTQYGSHTYGTKTQAEYDAVMKAVKNAINNSSIAPVNPLIARYDAGERSATMDKTSADYRTMLILEKTMGNFLDKTDAKYHENAIRAGGIGAYFTKQETNPESTSANSAYDVIVNKIGKCTADAQVMSAIYDSMGFSTQIRGSAGDAKCFVKISGQWWIAGNLMQANPTGSVVSGPTY